MTPKKIANISYITFNENNIRTKCSKSIFGNKETIDTLISNFIQSVLNQNKNSYIESVEIKDYGFIHEINEEDYDIKLSPSEILKFIATHDIKINSSSIMCLDSSCNDVNGYNVVIDGIEYKLYNIEDAITIHINRTDKKEIVK